MCLNYLIFAVPCSRSSYAIGIQTFDETSFITIKDPEDNVTEYEREYANSTIFSFYYSKMDVKVSSIIDLIDLPTFIGSVGGNLGLFVGFSFLGCIFFICDFMATSSYFSSLKNLTRL